MGRPQLISPSGEPVRFRVRKHLALLVYLALEPRGPHRRERMADLLWPNASPSDGRHSVATAISMLRGKLGRELVHGDRDHVQLIGSGLSVDLDRLAAGKILGDEFVPTLEIGGFLEDFDVPDATEFMMWRERQRARWLPLVRDALVLLIDRCRRTGDFRRIEQLGNSLLEIDELSEDGIRAKMEARAFDGDRVTALKVFQGWKAKLASELDAVPSSLIEGMAIRLRQRGWETAPVTNIPTVPTDQWRGRSFIGRGPEYETLYSAWESTCANIPKHVLVLGDSGVGKSTLLERVVTAAGLEGAAISRVQCYELEREIPYAAVGSLIEGLLDRPGASGTAPEWLAELARTVPQVRRR
ncbi:MAG TPA: AAA family ATPase, partial [Gemmatimonadales bacterium]|nr:AAA family ATPase [Gemmatimonadales bacterium]